MAIMWKYAFILKVIGCIWIYKFQCCQKESRITLESITGMYKVCMYLCGKADICQIELRE